MKPKKAKSKNTFYNGYNFRSRLEARWAVWFDWMEIKYGYETEGFDLDGKGYLPDFWLPERKFWIEIKPSHPSIEEIEKTVMLKEMTGYPVIFFVGQPWPTECFRISFERENGSYKEMFVDTWDDSSLDYRDIIAFRKARSARFEFGETPSHQIRFEFGDVA
jgi:hypothetical protein